MSAKAGWTPEKLADLCANNELDIAAQRVRAMKQSGALAYMDELQIPFPPRGDDTAQASSNRSNSASNPATPEPNTRPTAMSPASPGQQATAQDIAKVIAHASTTNAQNERGRRRKPAELTIEEAQRPGAMAAVAESEMSLEPRAAPLVCDTKGRKTQF